MGQSTADERSLQDVRCLLAQAISRLGSADTAEHLTSLLFLAEAAVALNAPRPRPFPHLPLELITLIIEYAQDPAPYFHERQQTNMALSLVSHDFYQLVRPRLLAEVHLTRPSQLPGLDALRQTDPSRSSHVELFTLTLDLGELDFRSDDDWLGFHLKPVVDWLASATQVHLCIPDLAMHDVIPGYVEDICGQRWDLPGLLEERNGVAEAHLNLPDGHTYIYACRYHTLLAPGRDLRRLHIPGHQPMREMQSLLRDLFEESIGAEPHPWE